VILLRAPLALGVIALTFVPLAAAQSNNTSPDPTMNESDFDTSTPPADDAYLNDTGGGANGTTTDPTLSDSDFDTSVPSADTSYLGDGSGTTPPPGSEPAKATPGFEAALLLGVVVAAAVALRRRES
jgi:hypothetical protein